MNPRGRLARLEKRTGGGPNSWGDRIRRLTRGQVDLFHDLHAELRFFPRTSDRDAVLRRVKTDPKALPVLEEYWRVRQYLGEPLSILLAHDPFARDHPDVPGRMDYLQAVHAEWVNLPVLTTHELQLMIRMEAAEDAVRERLGYFTPPEIDADGVATCPLTGLRYGTEAEWRRFGDLRSRLARGELRRSADWLDAYLFA